jgi:hypothetical protein
MTDLLELALDDFVPSFADAQPDWADVVVRSRPGTTACASPLDRRGHPRRAVAIAFALLLIVVLAPVSFALLQQFRETPRQFVDDPNQPENARKIISRYLSASMVRSNRQPQPPKLLAIKRVILTTTPGGAFGVYALTFARGFHGIAIISSKTGGIGAVTSGPAQKCPFGWALQAGPSMVERPGRTPVYLAGRAAPQVAAMKVLYPSGQTRTVALENHYFLAWVLPSVPKPGAKRGSAPPATVIAVDARGRILGELGIRGYGRITRRAGQSPDTANCG